MKKQLSVFLSFLLVLTLLLPIQASAKEDTPFDEYGIKSDVTRTTQELLDKDGWQVFKKRTNIDLNYEWKINFSEVATDNKIQAITIERNNESVPVTINYDKGKDKIVTVKPKQNLLGGQDYTLKVLLVNGKKSKIDFTTIKRNADIEPNDSYKDKDVSTIFIDETFTGNLLKKNTKDQKDFYKIIVPKNGLLTFNIKGTNHNTLSLNLYGKDGVDGDLLAYRKIPFSTSFANEVKVGTYYLELVKGTEDVNYEITTSLNIGAVNVEKALQNAQDAVYALPAPVDVMIRDEKRINDASILVAYAKALGADEIQIEELEGIIEELLDVIRPTEITSFTVVNPTTLEIRFNRAIDESTAVFKMKKEKETTELTAKTTKFNANHTVATVQFPNKLVGSYTLSFQDLTEIVTVEKEKVEYIEISSDKAIRTADNKVAVDYEVVNQYWESMQGEKVDFIATGDAVQSKTGNSTTGTVTIFINSDIQEGDSFQLTLKHTNGVEVTKAVTISSEDSKIVEVQIMQKDKTVKLNKIDYDKKETLDFESLVAASYIKVTSQYGETVSLEKTGTKFSDGIAIQGRLSFTKIEGDLIIENNGTQNAAVTELPKGAKFEVVVSVSTTGSTKSSSAVSVNVIVGHTPKADAEAQKAVDDEAKKITKDKLGVLVTGNNVLTKAQGLVATGYDVDLISSGNRAISKGIVTQEPITGKDATGDVVFKVTKGKFNSEVKVNLTVRKKATPQ